MMGIGSVDELYNQTGAHERVFSSHAPRKLEIKSERSLCDFERDGGDGKRRQLHGGFTVF